MIYQDRWVSIFQGDCLDVLRTLPGCSVDAIVTDPPYNLSFMGKAWDAHPSPLAFQQWCTTWASECLRVLKPGGHLLAMGGTRTWHRLVCAVEDAGFDIRDSIAWLYGSGFPKSLDVGKAIDKTAESERWQGWGTALKPAHEPICVARKPPVGTVAANVLAHGTGALNIDASRIGAGNRPLVVSDRRSGNEVYGDGLQGSVAVAGGTDLGRWPANVILDEGQARALDGMSGTLKGAVSNGRKGERGLYNDGIGPAEQIAGYADIGGASRFFYCAKAPKKERPVVNDLSHPTVKPLSLMRWLVRLVTPPDGTVLDPFAGSGTTVEAAMIEGFRSIGIDDDPNSIGLIMQRIERQRDEMGLLA